MGFGYSSHAQRELASTPERQQQQLLLMCLLQPIKLKLRHQVETAIMCQIKTDHDKFLTRLAAMDKRNPLYAFMFARDGTLLFTNEATLRKYGGTCIGDTPISLA